MNRTIHRLQWTTIVSFALGLLGCGGGTNDPVDTPPTTYAVSGTLSGLGSGKSLTLQVNGTDNLTVGANGTFTFPTADAATYAITVLTPPAGQTCTVSNGSGTNIADVSVACIDNVVPTYSVGGTVSGLGSGKSLVLRNNGGSNLTVGANGTFTFPTNLANAAAYAVTVLTPPTGQTCTASNASGAISGANITNVNVACVNSVVPTYSVGGTVSGLGSGKLLVLRNNGADNLTVGANGTFTFPTNLANAAAYAVTVFTLPVGQTCTVSNASGAIVGANVTNVGVACVTPGGGTGRAFYVAPTGSDATTNTGTSAAAPLRTIAAASAKAQPGDTVFLMQGNYGEPIVPARSGEPGRPITYKKYGADTPTLVGGTNQADLSGRSYIVIDGINFKDARGSWVLLNAASTHNRVTNGNFETALAWSGFDLSTGASFNQFDHNTITGTCVGGSPPIAGVLNRGTGGPGNGFTLTGNAHHNIIEDNTLLYFSHYGISLQEGHNNVIKGNHFANKWHAAIALYAANGKRVYENLVEKNTIVDSGDEHLLSMCEGDPRGWTWERNKFSALQMDATESIVRGNVFINNGQTNMETYRGPAQNNRIYNNSYSMNYRSVYLWGETGGAGSFVLSNNVYKNNVFYQDVENAVFANSASGTMGRNAFQANDIFSTSIRYRSTTGLFSLIEGAYPDEWSGNFSRDPQFVDAAGRDLHLRPSSGLINRGAFLTTVVGSGNAATLRVADSYYFTDGYGIVEGDTIQLAGSTATARITAVDRSTHTLTLSNALAFTDGQGVALRYSGSAPDVGAFEYGF